MKAHTLTLLTIFVIITACSNHSSKFESNTNSPKIYYDGENYKIIGDVDTATMISLYDIKEKDENIVNINENIDSLSATIDTIELTYYFPFCDCQEWVVSSIHEKAFDEDTTLNNVDSRGQTQFNSNHEFYIEPANPELELNWRICVNGTKVRFIGRKYRDLRLPEHSESTVDNPPMGKVFRYYSYEIIKPYKFWGPKKFMEIQEMDGRKDSIFLTVILDVE